MDRPSTFLFWYDFLARPYDPTRGQFTGPDQMSEKYYPWNPWVYCKNSPINRIDPVVQRILKTSSLSSENLNRIHIRTGSHENIILK